MHRNAIGGLLALAVVSPIVLGANSCDTSGSATQNASDTRAQGIVSSAASSSSHAAASTSAAPAKPVTFSVNGSKQTPAFHVTGPFTMGWTTKADGGAPCSDVLVLVTVYAKGKNPNADIPDAGPFNQSGCDSYSTEVNVGDGDYFLNADAANATVTITITFH